jgi:hypothetical protein
MNNMEFRDMFQMLLSRGQWGSTKLAAMAAGTPEPLLPNQSRFGMILEELLPHVQAQHKEQREEVWKFIKQLDAEHELIAFDGSYSSRSNAKLARTGM